MLRLRETTKGMMWGTGSISHRGLLEEGRFKTWPCHTCISDFWPPGLGGDNIVWLSGPLPCRWHSVT